MAQKHPEHPSIRQSKEALLEAAQAAVADQKNRPVDPGPPRIPEQGSRTLFQGILLVMIAVGAGLLVFRPTWLAGPKLPAESPVIRAASATLSLVDAMSRVQAFLGARGRLPGRLEEAGVANQAIRFKPIDGSAFEISIPAGDSLVSLRSTDSLKPRVVEAILALQRRT